MYNIEEKIKHLEFIQNTITRMSSNSFLLKGWSVTLVAALFALAAKESNSVFVLIAFLPTFIFWFLDAYFLHQERLFRKLYDRIRLSQNNIEPFSMDTSNVKDEVKSFSKTLFVPTVSTFHVIIIIVTVSL